MDIIPPTMEPVENDMSGTDQAKWLVATLVKTNVREGVDKPFYTMLKILEDAVCGIIVSASTSPSSEFHRVVAREILQDFYRRCEDKLSSFRPATLIVEEAVRRARGEGKI